jgi:hypothetical protein
MRRIHKPLVFEDIQDYREDKPRYVVEGCAKGRKGVRMPH